MATEVLTIDPQTTAAELYADLPEGAPQRRQRLYPLVDDDGTLIGVVAWSDVLGARDELDLPAHQLVRSAVVAHPDETLRAVADRMITTGHGVLPVVAHGATPQLVGLVSQFDLLAAHGRSLVEERHRERPLSLWPAGRAQLAEPAGHA